MLLLDDCLGVGFLPVLDHITDILLSLQRSQLFKMRLGQSVTFNGFLILGYKRHQSFEVFSFGIFIGMMHFYLAVFELQFIVK